MVTRHRTAPRRHRRAAGNAGFTLIELMVALGIGGLAISTIYAIGMTATYEFQRQEQVARTQMSLRTAMNLVKRDIMRAGFLSTPNAVITAPGMAQQTCGGEDPTWTSGGNGTLSAFSLFNDDVAISAANENDALAPAGTNNNAAVFSNDSVVLFGNYETTSEYSGIQRISNTQIGVSPNWHNFRTDFTNWFVRGVATPTYQAAQFTNVFRVGRAIRIQTTRRLKHFATITAVAPPTATGQVNITFTPPIPNSCFADVQNGAVAPLSFIQLRVMNRTGGVRFAAGIGPIAQLMRREVDPNDRTALLPMVVGGAVFNTRSLLDYVVAFNLAFTMTSANGPNAADTYQLNNFATAANVNAAPERIRGVNVQLAVRTPYQDPTMAFNRVTCGTNLRCFQVFGTRPGSARVRWLQAELFVPNVANEGY